MNDKDFLNLDILDTDVFSPEYFTDDFRKYVFNCMKSNYNSIMLDSITRLREDIKWIDKFFRWNKTKEKCFSWNTSPFYYIIPSLFASSKEAWYWKRKELRKIQMADVENIDTSDLYIIEWPDNFSKLDIFCEIRDAIEHKRTVYNKNGVIMVDNPNVPRKHPYEFKAVVPYHVLFDFIKIVDKYDRRQHFDTFLFREDPNESELLDYKLEDALNNGYFCQIMLKNSANHPFIIDKSVTEISEFVRNHPLSESQMDLKEINLTDNQKEIIYDFFSKNKQKFSIEKLHYVAQNLIDNNRHEYFYYALLSCLWKLEPTDTYQDFVDKYFSKIGVDNVLWMLSAEYWRDGDKLEVIKTLYDWLSKTKQENWQPLIWHSQWIFKYLVDKIKKMGFKYNENKYARHESEFDNWNIKITEKELAHLGVLAANTWRIYHYLFDEFPNWLRIQYIKLVYTTILSNNNSWNTNDTWNTDDSWNTTRSRVFTEEERIRDAMVHNQYTHLHWVKNIIMRDWYDKRSNSWNWEKVYDLKDLYDDSYKKFKEYIDNQMS